MQNEWSPTRREYGSLCRSHAEDGRYDPLLKALPASVCLYDCAFCYNHSGNDIPIGKDIRTFPDCAALGRGYTGMRAISVNVK